MRPIIDAIDAAAVPVDLDDLTVKLTASVHVLDCSLTAFHIIPGPNRGYSNSSMRVLMVCFGLTNMAKCGFQREILNSLRSPFGFQLAAWNSPDLFRIGFKKGFEKSFAKPVGHPLLEGILFLVWEKYAI